MKKNKWIAVVFAVVFLILVVGFFLYKDNHVSDERVTIKKNPEAVSMVPKEKAMRHEVSVRKKIMSVSPNETGPDLPDVKEDRRNQLQERVERFFKYLDKQDYIKAYDLKGGSYHHFLGLVAKLSSSSPVVSGEMDDLYILRRNISHFYRIMGKRDVSLVKDILSNEGKIIEPVIEMLYKWGSRETAKKGGPINPCTNEQYEYAVFFLDTVSGKAYLLRRKSGARMLLTYYSILILDRADRDYLNRCGVDIVPHVNLLMDDITRHSGLDHKDKYLKKLESIKKSREGRS
ncbi:MAG: hypothetical protein U9N38_02075 [Thermodesulfobacteriota bacterium]|nr:hypothetical protein [Thermodesulfobacteriota bacterium]